MSIQRPTLLSMGVLTEEQLDEVWHQGGLKHNIKRFHRYLTERGLMPYVNSVKLQNHIYELLYRFFVQGMEEDKDGRQSFPADPDGGSEECDTTS